LYFPTLSGQDESLQPRLPFSQSIFVNNSVVELAVDKLAETNKNIYLLIVFLMRGFILMSFPAVTLQFSIISEASGIGGCEIPAPTKKKKGDTSSFISLGACCI